MRMWAGHMLKHAMSETGWRCELTVADRRIVRPRYFTVSEVGQFCYETDEEEEAGPEDAGCLLYTSPSPRDS